jgi:hypothetical protein
MPEPMYGFGAASSVGASVAAGSDVAGWVAAGSVAGGVAVLPHAERSILVATKRLKSMEILRISFSSKVKKD